MENIEEAFDNFLFQVIVGKMKYSDLEKGIQYYQKQQVPTWQLRFGFTFNVYSNDHFIDRKPHFHLENKQDQIHCKIDFNGNILESIGRRPLPPRVQKELKYFLNNEKTKEIIVDMWNTKNPTLKV